MKNKIFAAFLVLALLFSLSACTSSQTWDTKITSEEAESIAFQHAGVDSADVSRIRTNLDRDDGILKYEVEFHMGTTEYNYDINAQTGEIISFDQDIN